MRCNESEKTPSKWNVTVVWCGVHQVQGNFPWERHLPNMISMPRWWWWRKERNSHPNFSRYNTMEHSLLWRGNCRQGSRKLQHWWKSWNNKNSGKLRVEVWTCSPYVAAEAPASGTRLATKWQLFQIANFFYRSKGLFVKSSIASQVWCWNFGQRDLNPPKIETFGLIFKTPIFQELLHSPCHWRARAETDSQ